MWRFGIQYKYSCRLVTDWQYSLSTFFPFICLSPSLCGKWIVIYCKQMTVARNCFDFYRKRAKNKENIGLHSAVFCISLNQMLLGHAWVQWNKRSSFLSSLYQARLSKSSLYFPVWGTRIFQTRSLLSLLSCMSYRTYLLISKLIT
jgi:hypothetical protein